MTHELDLPVVDAAGPFPGAWSADELGGSGQVWKGAAGWLTKHGASTVRWLLGKPVAAFGVLHEDGRIIERCETYSPTQTEFWRRPSDHGAGFTTGLLTIDADGVSFVDQPVPKRTNEGENALFDAIMAHPRVLETFRDDGFAGAFNEYLRNEGFKRNGVDMAAWSGSWRYVGGMIAEIRGLGESYIDFYIHAPDFTEEDTAKVEDFFAEIGWHRMVPIEVAEDHGKALALLGEVEGRAQNSIPKEDRIGLAVDRSRIARPNSLSGRMHIASVDGKATAEEHHLFFQLYDVGKDDMTTEEIAELLGQPNADTPPSM